MRNSTPFDPVTVSLRADASTAALRAEVRSGLSADPKELSPKWLYDSRGCELFDRITRLAEYYPTRAERSILATRAGEIALFSAAPTPWSSWAQVPRTRPRSCSTRSRTSAGLSAMWRSTSPNPRFGDTVAKLSVDHTDVQVLGVVGELQRAPRRVFLEAGRPMVAFLGGAVGNLHAGERILVPRSLASVLVPGDSLLLGTDLIKDRSRLIAADHGPRRGRRGVQQERPAGVLDRELQGGSLSLDEASTTSPASTNSRLSNRDETALPGRPTGS
ncbi:MAG: L-histidine N(alpha)-methyltransferase [Microthrixaceae bacterium]